MNKQRRKQIDAMLDRLRDLESDTEILQGEEQEAFDNLPEGLQAGERGQAMEDAVQNLADALDAVQSVMSYLEEASK